MDKKQKMLLLIVGILVLIAIVIGFLAFNKEKEKKSNSTVNVIKEEYESLNGVVNDLGYTYVTVDISKDIKIEKLEIKQVLDIFNKEDAVILFGNTKDNICRNAINPFISAVESVGIEKVYYVDTYNLVDNTTEEYKELLEKLDVLLQKYEIEDENGNKIGTVQKKIFTPTVVVVKDKEVADYHLGTIESNMADDKINNELTKEEKEELFDVYTNMLLKISDSSCNDESKC